MRFIAAPILILLVLAQTFSQWMVYAAFKINQAYIAKNTCENRYRPQLHCNGNCVLMKKLKQQEKEDQNGPATLKMDAPALILSSRSFFAGLPQVPVTVYNRTFPSFDTGKPVDMTFAFFHPPRA
jgi:hypothetical protein